MSKILFLDTTLRDGEQSPGATMFPEEKRQIALLLSQMGVDIIEAGFAAASKGDILAIQGVCDALKNTTTKICSLSRCTKNDIDAAYEALKSTPNRRIHIFLATSKIHLEYKLKKTEEEILDIIRENISYAKQFFDDIQFSPEDASRTDIDFLCRVCELVIELGVKTINITDTVGYALPFEFQKRIETIKSRVRNIDKATISVHCHNDLGLAVANTIAGVMGGARQVECTINGIGERAGNCALEEVVMTLKTRSDQFNVYSGLDTTKIYPLSQLVSKITGLMVQRNKAIVGANAFAHQSGIHQDGILKNRNTYEIMTPADIGLDKNTLTLGKHSGRAALKVKLMELGYQYLTEEKLTQLMDKVKTLADTKKDITDQDILKLYEELVD